MSVHEGKKKISYHIFHAIFQLQLKLVDICMNKPTAYRKGLFVAPKGLKLTSLQEIVNDPSPWDQYNVLTKSICV